MLHHAFPARRAFVALTALSLTLAACGGGDDGDEVATATTEAAEATTATTAPATTEAPATTAPAAAATTAPAEDTTATTAAGDTEDDTIIVGSFDEMPQECRDMLADFLRTIEPAVSEIDWTTATIGDFQAVSDELSGEFESMDAMASSNGCDAYDFADDADSIEPMIALAEEEAPGTVPWLEFLATLDDDPVVSADLPADCDGAIAYMDDLITGGATMNDIPFNDMADISQVLTVISTECDEATVSEFYARPEITEFLG